MTAEVFMMFIRLYIILVLLVSSLGVVAYFGIKLLLLFLILRSEDTEQEHVQHEEQEEEDGVIWC